MLLSKAVRWSPNEVNLRRAAKELSKASGIVFPVGTVHRSTKVEGEFELTVEVRELKRRDQ